MTTTFRELVIGGVLVAPIISYVIATITVAVVLRRMLYRIRFARYFSNPQIAELSLYVAIFGLLVAIF